MVGVTREEMESMLLDPCPGEIIEHCLGRIFEDGEKRLDDEVVAGLTFDELIRALIWAKALENEPR